MIRTKTSMRPATSGKTDLLRALRYSCVTVEQDLDRPGLVRRQGAPHELLLKATATAMSDLPKALQKLRPRYAQASNLRPQRPGRTKWFACESAD